MKHIHAELMAQYAQDAMETDKPWERWEYTHKFLAPNWESAKDHLKWTDEVQYRRKPRTININGHEVPEPVREALECGRIYYMPLFHPYSVELTYKSYWSDDRYDHHLLKSGVIHLTSEAAESHAKALLSFTEQS